MEKEKNKKVIKFSMDMDKVEEMIDKLMDSMMDKFPEEKQPFVMGFTINFNSDDLPVIEELKEIETDSETEKHLVTKNFSVLLAEAHYFPKEVLVSFELPKNISRNDLTVEIKEKTVLVKSKKFSYSKRISLKEKINPKKFSSNFNNSVLELTFIKK